MGGFEILSSMNDEDAIIYVGRPSCERGLIAADK